MSENKKSPGKYLTQASTFPIELEIERGEGIYLYDTTGKKYIDLISGICVNNLGHCHPKIVKAVQEQSEKAMHVMVYGIFDNAPQKELAQLLAGNLPGSLGHVFFVNSGSEAVEGALKLTKRYTGRTEIIAFKNAYHGSNHGSLSILGNEELKKTARPLLPDIRFIEFNNEDNMGLISTRTACVVVEPIQGEAGYILPENDFLKKLKARCADMRSMLIFDEVQTGYGRTGTLFAFEQFGVVPDILCISKAAGGGLPLGAFISSEEIFEKVRSNDYPWHMTTFGGNPVCCAASKSALEIIINDNILDQIPEKERLFREKLQHIKIKNIRGIGLLLALELENTQTCQELIAKCLENGLVTDSLLLAPDCMRITPPLIISEEQITEACKIILESIDD
ncbi:aspartate aminotransferase family protein [Candidatus Amoebophilus asiaticus]|nr:aspartate aminotransferase family protein [Candidatus Amoebophilus asiaticus]